MVGSFWKNENRSSTLYKFFLIKMFQGREGMDESHKQELELFNYLLRIKILLDYYKIAWGGDLKNSFSTKIKESR